MPTFRTGILVAFSVLLTACISPDNETFQGMGAPDVTACGAIPGALDGADYKPQTAPVFGSDGRSHPDLFYLAWSSLDNRSDLRFPAKGYDAGSTFEDKLLVSRENPDGTISTWQLLPKLAETCEDLEKIRVHSFDVAPDGRSLFVSMRTDENPRLQIYELNLNTYEYRSIAKDVNADLLHPTYVGDDPVTGHRVLFVAKTVTRDEIPVNYRSAALVDEYDRAPTTLIYRLDAETGSLFRIGFNNSHQTDPVAVTRPDGTRLVLFTQWEHQATTNRFAIWKTQVDGSDNFTFFGQESRKDKSAANLAQLRPVTSGPYKDHYLVVQGHRSNHPFANEGDILLFSRDNLDLRDEVRYLSRMDGSAGFDQHIARSPEHYNEESFAYSYRADVNQSYGLYIKDYATVTGSKEPGHLIISDAHYHFVQPHAYRWSGRGRVAPTDGDLTANRSTFTNTNLAGRAGFLVANLGASANGVQHQLDGIAPENISLQFFIPSHTFSGIPDVGGSSAIGVGNSPELSVPASGFLRPQPDGSFGAIVKEGLYTWKVNKRFNYGGTEGAEGTDGADIWLPVRTERQEISFVRDRVLACNQCHQERDQQTLDQYADFTSIAEKAMRGDLMGMPDITKNENNEYYVPTAPDFFRDVAPLLTAVTSGKACVGCHNARDQLNLANITGPEPRVPAWRALLSQAHETQSGRRVPYVSSSINPMGMDNSYGPAPFLWSLLLNDDLAPPDGGAQSRPLNAEGDYGAQYVAEIEQDIADINKQYDHSSHWTPAQVQQFITYTSTQSAVGLSDLLEFTEQEGRTLDTTAGQKAYQVMLKNCFECHNSLSGSGVDDPLHQPLTKRYTDSTDAKNPLLRFVVRSHVPNKDDTSFSQFTYESNIGKSMSATLESARYQIDYGTPTESPLLIYPRSDALHVNVTPNHPVLADAEYQLLVNWVEGVTGTNVPPVIDQAPTSITINEYDPPSLHGPVIWNDGENELAQAFLNASPGSNDSVLALEYDSFVQAQIKAYGILGDQGDHSFTLSTTDGEAGETRTIPVTVNSDYTIPVPTANLPNAYAFYTVRKTGELRRVDTNGGDRLIGVIDGYSPSFTTVYRRDEKGWLYFFDQPAQRFHVVDETNAQTLFTIKLDHEPNRETATHKQTVFIGWWRPVDGLDGSSSCSGGELQALLESKLSDTKNGYFYVSLGCGEPPAGGGELTMVPDWRTKLEDGQNTAGVYVWRRATFMSKWTENSIDRLNVLNLVTGKPKALSNYSFSAKNGYEARDYWNVRAVVVAPDGAFYGFNKDLNSSGVEVFNFDPLEGVQIPVEVPPWLQSYLINQDQYATPFLVIESR